METIEKVKFIERVMNEKLEKNKIRVEVISKPNKMQGEIIIYKNNILDKKFNIEAIGNFQIKIMEQEKVIECGLFINNLDIWIYNLYNPVKYLYKFFGGTLNKSVLTRSQISKISNRLTPDNQPIVKEYVGPIYEKMDYGIIYLRYETQEIYNMLSA